MPRPYRAPLATLAIALIASAAPWTSALAQEPDGLAVALALEEALVSVAESAQDGVVTLVVSGSHLAADDAPTDPDELDEYLRRRRPDHFPFQGTGSGFIVDDSGTIYTNAHVVSGADTIEVRFRNGRRGKADVIG